MLGRPQQQSSRSERGHTLPAHSIDTNRTPHGRRTSRGRLSKREIAEKTKQALENYSEGEIAVAADCSKDTAQSWKLGRRAPDSDYMMALGSVLDEIGMMVAEEMDLGRFYDHDARYSKALRDLSLEETPQGQWARWFLRQYDLKD
jgi:hypothetical protein